MELTSEAERARFREDGFIVIGGLFEPGELARFGAAVDRGVAARTAYDARPLEQRSRYQQSFRQVINLWEDHPEVRVLTFHPKVTQAAAELLGVPALRLWHDQALYEEAGGRGTDAHHDQPYWPLAETNTITAWIPFQDATLENGCLGFVPGSHRCDEKRAFPNIFADSGYDLEHGPEARGIPPRWTPVKAGEVGFHHSMTLHVATPNQSATTRRVHTMIFFADGSTRKHSRQPHPSVDRARIAPGALVASDVTPLAWPRPAGDLPDAPAPPDSPLPGWPGMRGAVSF